MAPLYYDFSRQSTTNGSANTCSTHFRLLTVANQATCRITSVAVSARPTNATAGAGELSIATLGGAGVGGTSYTLNPTRSGGTAASTTAFTDASSITSGSTTTRRRHVGWAQTGGQNGWVALEPDDAYVLAANGGANGNLQLDSFATGTTQGLTVSGTVQE